MSAKPLTVRVAERANWHASEAASLQRRALALFDAAVEHEAEAMRLCDAVLCAVASLRDAPGLHGAAMFARPEPDEDRTPTAGELAWDEADSGRWDRTAEGEAWLAAHPGW